MRERKCVRIREREHARERERDTHLDFVGDRVEAFV